MLEISKQSILTKKQSFFTGWKQFKDYGRMYKIRAEVRLDDHCGNGHNSFAITGEICTLNGRIESCGCLHEDIAKHFPELAPFIKWHLSSTDGPMHYVANTMYHAGDTDTWGLRKGEPMHFRDVVTFGDNPIEHILETGLRRHMSFMKWLQERRTHFDFEVIEIDGRYTFGGYGEKRSDYPFSNEAAALNMPHALQTCDPHFKSIATDHSEGREPNLEYARNSAVWPDATLEQLRDKEALTARLPGLLADFKADVEKLGLVW